MFPCLSEGFGPYLQDVTGHVLLCMKVLRTPAV